MSIFSPEQTKHTCPYDHTAHTPPLAAGHAQEPPRRAGAEAQWRALHHRDGVPEHCVQRAGTWAQPLLLKAEALDLVEVVAGLLGRHIVGGHARDGLVAGVVRGVEHQRALSGVYLAHIIGSQVHLAEGWSNGMQCRCKQHNTAMPLSTACRRPSPRNILENLRELPDMRALSVS